MIDREDIEGIERKKGEMGIDVGEKVEDKVENEIKDKEEGE